MTLVKSDESREPAGCGLAHPVPCPATAHVARLRRLVGLLNQYGAAKFGDEWWPGNAAAWLSLDEAAELATLQEGVTTASGGAAELMEGRQTC
jgi:hypothetical protein